MIFLFFFILLIQFFTYWIFEPITSLLEHLLEIRTIPVIALVGFIFLFSGKNIEYKK
tara:strand:- start:177 stop:347 length:171 start_codon:yes stop_codon:yes gene_type:complete